VILGSGLGPAYALELEPPFPSRGRTTKWRGDAAGTLAGRSMPRRSPTRGGCVRSEARQRLVYTAQSKRDFYCRDAVCQFVFSAGAVPINPFRVFGYFLDDRVPRDTIREANRELLLRCDELWVFGHALADGVIIEISQAASRRIPIRFFTISSRPDEIGPLRLPELEFEEEVEQRTRIVRNDLRILIQEGRADEVVHAMGRSSELTGV